MTTIEEALQHAYDTGDYSAIQARDGREVLGLFRRDMVNDSWPWLATFGPNGKAMPSVLMANGRYAHGDNYNDIILRPKVHKVWVEVWRQADGRVCSQTHDSPEELAASANEQYPGTIVLATDVIELREGEFLPGTEPNVAP